MIRLHETYLRVAAALALLAAASSAFAQQTEQQLLATLQNASASLEERCLACKQLAIVGGEAAVPVLAALLGDEPLDHYARYGLEPIPSPKVDEALLAALPKLQGRQLVGLITSIANRGQPAAIPALAAKMQDADRDVARAAAHAIARIGTPQAAEILGGTLTADTAAACLVCGEVLGKQGHQGEGVQLLVKVHESSVAPEHVRLAALLQAIELQGAEGRALLVTALSSNDDKVFQTGLRAARLLKAGDAAPAVLGLLKDIPPARTAALVTLLGDLADRAALPAVAEAAAAKDPAVRIAALEALATLGSSAHVKLLADAAADPVAEVAARAQETLASLSGTDIDRAVLALLDDPQRRALGIRLIGQRRIAAAVPQLLAAVDGPQRLEVLAALGETISLDNLDVLGKQLETDSPETREAVRKALHAACYRMPDRDATASKLAGYLGGASEPTVEYLMDELRRIGGDKALALVSAAAQGGDATRKEYATRALGEWLDVSAAPVLLALARSEGTGKFGIRGIRGYVRLARQFDMPEEQRLAMCRTAMEVAQRDDDKQLVLEVAQRYPSLPMLQLAVEAGKSPALKDAASSAAMAIVQKVRGREAQELLNQLGQAQVDLEILRAEYGGGGKVKDVTEILAKRARRMPLIALPKDGYNQSFGGDPAPGERKQLTIRYRIDGKEGEATFQENDTILLPVPK